MGKTRKEKNGGVLDLHDDTYAMVDFLLKYEFYDGERMDCPIVIVGPSGSSPTTMLRVYAYGGMIGRVATRTGHSHLAEAEKKKKEKGEKKEYAYPDYLGENYFSAGKEADRKYLQHMEEKYVKSGGEQYRGDSLCQKLSNRLKDILTDPCPWQQLDKPEYLDLILKAAEKRFTNGKEDLGERRVQTSIIKQHMNKAPEDGWCVIDMEYTVKGEQSQTGKEFKPDLVVFDKNHGFGFIELKYADKSTKNLDKHYTDTQGILQNIMQSGEAVKIIGELKSRSGFLWQYGLISDAIYQAMEAFDAPKLWQGFLFVGGKRENAVRFAKRLAEKNEDIITNNECRFAFYPHEKENSDDSIRNIRLDFHSMQPYGKFTGEREDS